MHRSRSLVSVMAALALALQGGSGLAASPEAAASAPEASRFSVEVRGQGPDVILIPGLASPRAVWDDLAPRLAGRYRLHLVQVAGFAGEPAGANAEGPILRPLVEALHRYIVAKGLQRPAIIGHSLGGLVGLMLAETYPQDVGRLLVVDSFPFISSAFDPSATVAGATPQAAALRDGVMAQSDQAFAAAEQGAVLRFSLRPEARQRVLGWALASDRSAVARATYDDMTTDARPDLGRIAGPVTVLYPYDPSMGAPAPAVEAIYARAYAELPKAQLQRVDGAYHFLMLDQPDAFAERVEAFLK
jgi:pimeloyl-ACP methyl ester carboxylesterase